jgi:hypothetical protein
MTSKSLLLPVLLAIGTCGLASAQNPALAPADLKYSQNAYHLVADVDLEFKPGSVEHFQFDRYQEGNLERVKTSDGAAYASRNGKWLKSDDWGDTGTPVSDELAGELATYASVVMQSFTPPQHHDPAQGGTAWKFISQSQDKDVAYFVYEESREKPNPDGVYPRFTFEKWPKDHDGSLHLSKVTGQLNSDGGPVPFAIQFDYLFPLPPGTSVKIFPTGKPPVTVTVPPATNQ